MTSRSPIIVALDCADHRAALELGSALDPADCRLKVGKELFTRCGPPVIEALHEKGFEVFLDLKFHDIPNTVAGACRAAAELGCWMINVHASGGRAMLDAAREAIAHARQRPLLIAVTVLTSIDDAGLEELGIDCGAAAMTARLARLAADTGVDGVVSSAHDIESTKASCGAGFVVVCPGIRPAGSAAGDQKRVATPRGALDRGADYLVIGRPITAASDPGDALRSILEQTRAG